jgi:preprotein translocase subunit SecA
VEGYLPPSPPNMASSERMPLIHFNNLVKINRSIAQIIDLMSEAGLLPKELKPEEGNIKDQIFKHISTAAVENTQIDEINLRYIKILSQAENLIVTAQAFYADSALILHLQPIVEMEPHAITLANIMAVLVNAMWGILVYFPAVLSYLKTKDAELEPLVNLFIAALLTYISAALQFDKTMAQMNTKVEKAVGDQQEEETVFN